MKIAIWIISIIGSAIGGLVTFVGLIVADGAPQEAAVAAIGIACAVIPYCLARAASEILKSASE